MRRRTFLETVASAGAVGTAGCLAVRDDERAPPTPVTDPPPGVYRPTRSSDLGVVGSADAGPFRLALLYSYPSRFWELVGRERYLRDVDPDDEVHLMATAWDPDTGILLPEVGLSVEVARDGELVAHEAVYAMLSQRLGFHYGDNFRLPGDGWYEVTVAVGGLQHRRTGAFAGRFREPASATIAFDYRREERDALSRTTRSDAGTPGAVAPGEVPALPGATAPETLSGSSLGRATVDDLTFAASVLRGDRAARFGADRYLVVSPRTRYNGLLVPSLGLRVRVDRGDATVAETIATRTVDPVVGYHYGLAVPPLRSGDRVVLETMTPPQVARHEGYERAFLTMPEASLRVS